MNITRMGHYHTPVHWESDALAPSSSYCWTAQVDGTEFHGGAEAGTVNLHVWDHKGVDQGNRENVVIMAEGIETRGASFHLSQDCPDSR